MTANAGESPAATVAAARAETARAPMRAMRLSLVAGAALLAAKFLAWAATDSQTVFSDAMESIVNVVAAAVALGAVLFSTRPADRSHPYGHGKVEFMTGGFEGGLIAFAAIVIVYEAVRALLRGAEPHDLDLGIGVVAGAGVGNLLLGLHLVRTGRRCDSVALVADGQHVLSDSWTSFGAVVGLVLVRVTGLAWIDPCAAIVVAVQLLATGVRLVRTAARGLLDESDPQVVADVAAALEGARRPGIIEIHDLRAINVGGYHHVDLHVVVPEFWPVDRAHREMDDYERRCGELRRRPGELQFHVDPCERAYCARCDHPDCPVRVTSYRARRRITAETAVLPPDPVRPATIHEDPHPRPVP